MLNISLLKNKWSNDIHNVLTNENQELVDYNIRKTKTDIISVIGVGDIMLWTNYPASKYLPDNDDSYSLLSSVKDTFGTADLVIWNLEGCFSNDAKLVKRCEDPTKCYAFRMPDRYAKSLKKVGFDALTIANNHSGDFWDKWRYNTTRLLDSLNIAHAWWVKYPYTIYIKDNIKYGIISFSPNRWTLNINDTINAKKMVKELDKDVDIVIVTFHGGAEWKKHQNVTKRNEIFYGENRWNVYAFSKTVIDSGADIVFWHWPHVPRAINIYKNRFIAYSLWNFCTYSRFNLSYPNNVAPIIKVNVDKNWKFIDWQIISAKQYWEWIVDFDSEQSASKIIRSLTETDFPDSDILIKENWVIEYQ